MVPNDIFYKYKITIQKFLEILTSSWIDRIDLMGGLNFTWWWTDISSRIVVLPFQKTISCCLNELNWLNQIIRQHWFNAIDTAIRWTLTNSHGVGIFNSTALFRHSEGTWSRSILLHWHFSTLPWSSSAHSLTWWLIITISSSFPPPCFNAQSTNQSTNPLSTCFARFAPLTHHLTAVIIAVTSTNHYPVTWILTKVTPLFFMMSLPLPGVRTIIGDGEMMTRGAVHRPRRRRRRLIPRWLMMDGIHGEMTNRVIYYWILTTTRKYRVTILGTGAKFSCSFGLTTCGRPQLELLLLLLFYDLGLRPI